MRITLLSAFLSVYFLSAAQEPAIIPKPVSLSMGKGIFQISPSTKIELEGSGLERSAGFLND
jgi:hypothetical protein